jgi:hypothetical protein
MRRIVTGGIVLLAFAAVGAEAPATLNTTSRPVLWAASVTSGAGPTTEIPECAPGCARFDLVMDLPAGVWTNKPGSVQVAIRWTSRTLGDNLRLYVYRGGTLLARSDGIIATAQSVLIREPANGSVQVYVAHDPDSPNATIAFEGLAQVEYDANPHPARVLTPDLEVRAQRNLGFDPGGVFFDMISPDHPSCYQSEVDEEGAQTCLRFDQIFANLGEGPVELRFAVPRNSTPAHVESFQRLYASDGSTSDRFAGLVEYHGAHEHYHYTSFGVSRLWSLDDHRRKAALVSERRLPRPVETTLVQSGKKVSFCLADIEIDSWAKQGDGPRQYNAPDCLFPAASDATHDHYVQGITNGWADVYDWYLPDQYMEVSGIADGVYLLETVADPDDTLIEADETNNCGGIYVRLSDLSSGAPRAEILGPGPSCTTGG